MPLRRPPRRRTDITAEQELAGLVDWLDNEVAPQMQKLELVAEAARKMMNGLRNGEGGKVIEAKALALVAALEDAGRPL